MLGVEDTNAAEETCPGATIVLICLNPEEKYEIQKWAKTCKSMQKMTWR
jgi:hypothetical protein